MKQQNGFGIIEVLVIFTIVIILGCTGWFVWNKDQSQQANTQPTDKSENSRFIASIIGSDEFELVDYIGACSELNNTCSASYIVKLSQPAIDDFRQTVDTLQSTDWQTNEGVAFSLDVDSLLASSSNTFDDRNISIYSLIALGLFGDDNYLEKNNVHLRLFAFDASEKQTNDSPYYIYESEVDGIFDWEKLLASLGEDEYYLNISLRQE